MIGEAAVKDASVPSPEDDVRLEHVIARIDMVLPKILELALGRSSSAPPTRGFMLERVMKTKHVFASLAAEAAVSMKPPVSQDPDAAVPMNGAHKAAGVNGTAHRDEDEQADIG